MQTIETKDGIVLKNIPDNVSDEQIKARIQQIRTGQSEAAPAPIQQPQVVPQNVPQQPMAQPAPASIEEISSFQQAGQELGSSLYKRKAKISSILERHGKGEISGEKGALFLMSELIQGGGDIAISGLSAITPKLVKEWAEMEIGANLDTPQGELLLKGVGKVAKWAKENPDQAELAEAVGTVGLATLAAGKAGSKWPVKKPSVKRGYADIIKPVQDKKIMQAGIETAEVTPITKEIRIRQTPKEKEITRLLQETKGVNPKNLATENFIAIKAAEQAERKALVKKLRAANIQVSRKEVNARLAADLKTAFDNEPLFVGKSLKGVQQIKDQAIRILAKNKQNLEGLHKTRIQLDKLAGTSMRFPEVGKAGVETAKSRAYKIARNSMNDLLETKYPGYQASTRKQHLWIEAQKAIKPKAALERPTITGRAAETMGDVPVIGRLFDPRTALKRNK